MSTSRVTGNKEDNPKTEAGLWPLPNPVEPSGRSPPQGFTAIHFAAQQKKLSCLQILVEEYKFPVDLPTNKGQTPLHLVIHKNRKSDILPCIDYLLKKGAAINS